MLQYSNSRNVINLSFKGSELFMTMDKKPEVKEGVNPVVAAVTGAVVGAGIVAAGAGAVVLSDEENRKKIKKVINNVKDRAEDYLAGIEKQADDKKSEIEEKIAEGTEKIEKATEAAKEELNK